MLGTAAKMVVGCLVLFFGMAFAVHEVKFHKDVLLGLDTHLPATMSHGAWRATGPAGRGIPALHFTEGHVRGAHCRSDLGTYTVDIHGSFGFHTATAPVRGCAAGKLQGRLERAHHVDRSSADGHEVLTFSTSDGHDVLTLRERGD